MNIALLTDGFYPFTLGGIQKHSYYLAKSWAQQSVQVHVYHPNDYKLEVLKEHFTEEELKHISFIYVQHPQSIKFPGHYIYNSYRYSKALYKQVGEQKYDAIYAQGFTGWYFLNHQKEINLITNLHGINMFQASVNFKHKLQLLLLRIPAKPIIKRSNKQISLGGKLTEILYHRGAKPNSVFELPNAISEEWISSTPPTSNSTRRFIFIGRYERLKGIEEINQVLAQLIQQNQGDFDMHFVGPIPKEKQIKDAANIIYHGAIYEEEKIQQLLKESDILLSPSWSEGMPTVILEAMASGCAIIATDVGAVSEQVDAFNGYLIPAGDSSALKHTISAALLLSNDELIAMKNASIQRVKEKFLWGEVAKRTVSEMKKVIGD